MQNERDGNTRARLLDACITCIERDGIDALTVRAIAREAGVNIAAINYYFRSKEALVEEVLGRTREVGFDALLREFDAMIEAEGGDVPAALRVLVPDFLRDATRYPKVAAAQFHDVLSRQDYEGPTARACRAFVEAFFLRVRSALPQGDETAQRERVAAFWSAIYLNVLMPRLWAGFVPRPLTDPSDVERSSAVLLTLLLGPTG